MAEGVIGRDVIPLLAGVLDQRAGDGVGFHLRGVADAEHVPMAIGAGDWIGVAAGHYMEDAFFERHVGYRGSERRIDIADQERDLVAIDQFSSLLDSSAGIPAGGVLHKQLRLATNYAALSVDLRKRKLRADQFVLPERRVSARQRIIEADLYLLVGKRLDNKWAGNLHRADRETSLEDRPPFDRDTRDILGHPILSPKASWFTVLMAGHLGRNGSIVQSNQCRITARICLSTKAMRGLRR
jgi:hypothetical protein